MTVYPSQDPFDDFCLYLNGPQCSVSDLKRVQIGEAVRRAVGGLAQRSEWSCEGGPRVSLYSRRGSALSTEAGLSLLEGFANNGERPLVGGREGSRQLAELGGEAVDTPTLRGHFCAIVADRQKMVIATDWLGFSHLYRVQVFGHDLISNRLQLLVEALRDLRQLRFRPVDVALAFVLDTSFSYETPAEGVSLLPADRVLEVSSKGLTERRRYDVARESQSLKSADYDQLIHQAALEICQNWRAGEAFAGDHPMILYLTGGVDSRMALAGAQAAGIRPWYYTYGASGCPDRRIAGLLAEQGGLERLEDASPMNESVHESVERWLSLGFHQRSASLLPVPLPSPGRVRVSGGLGECYRGFYTRMFQEKMGIEDRISNSFALADAMAKVVGNWSLVEKEVRETFVERLRLFIENEPLIRDTSAGADGFYALFRNRFHFGLDLRMCSADSLKLAPLYSPSAYLASLICDDSGRRHGKVAHDLIRILSPKLLEVELEVEFSPSIKQATPALNPRVFSPSPLTSTTPQASRAKPPQLRRGNDAYNAHLLEELGRTRTHLNGQDKAYFGLVKGEVVCKHLLKAEETGDLKRARALVMRARILREAAGTK